MKKNGKVKEVVVSKAKTVLGKRKRQHQKNPVVVGVRKIRGHGSYDVDGFAPGLSGSLGSSIGSYFGGATGGRIGKMAGDWFGKLIGAGAYQVKRNSLMSQGPPVFGSSDIRIRHRESLGVISTSSGAFVNELQFDLNPGLPASFPWLSRIAANFEQYDFAGLVFEFKTTSATAIGSTNTALGSIFMSTQYNVLNPVFANETEMKAYEFTVETEPCISALHPVECAPSTAVLDRHYIRTGPTPPDSDPRMYDMGRFEVATIGAQAASVAGDLWVSYDVILQKPKLINTGNISPYAHFTGVLEPGGDTVSVLKSVQTLTLQNLSVNSQQNSIVLFTPGNYFFLYTGYIDGTIAVSSLAAASASGTATISLGTFASRVAPVDVFTTYTGGSSPNTFAEGFVVKNAGDNGVITHPIITYTLASTSLATDLFIFSIPDGVSLSKFTLALKALENKFMNLLNHIEEKETEEPYLNVCCDGPDLPPAKWPVVVKSYRPVPNNLPISR